MEWLCLHLAVSAEVNQLSSRKDIESILNFNFTGRLTAAAASVSSSALYERQSAASMCKLKISSCKYFSKNLNSQKQFLLAELLK